MISQFNSVIHEKASFNNGPGIRDDWPVLTFCVHGDGDSLCLLSHTYPRITNSGFHCMKFEIVTFYKSLKFRTRIDLPSVYRETEFYL